MIIDVSTRAINILVGSKFTIDHPSIAEALTHPISYGIRVHTRTSRVNLHPDEWFTVMDALDAISVIEPGDTHEREMEAACTMRAQHRINGRIERLTAHPAYHHHGIAEISRVALPAHWLDTDHLFPSRRQALLNGASRGIDSNRVNDGTLHPRIKKVRGRVFTVWELREHVGPTAKEWIDTRVDR
jgi:hypothetical protein